MNGMKKPQFGLRTLLIAAILAPPLVAGVAYLSRSTDTPWWAIVGSVLLIAFWSRALYHVLRYGISRPLR